MKRATKAARKATSAKAKKEYDELLIVQVKEAFKKLKPEDRLAIWQEDFQELLSQAVLEHPVPTIGAVVGFLAGCWVDGQRGRREK